VATPASPALAGLLLAAGASRRFGSPKALARFRGHTLVERSAALLRPVCPAGILVVSGAEDQLLRKLLGAEVPVVHNPHWAAGMAASLACGIRNLPAADAVLVLPCDLPAVTEEDLGRLAAAWQAAPDRVAAAGWDGHQGPPAIFPRSRWPALLALQGDQGARGLLALEPRLVRVPMPNAALDVDTPEDLARLDGLLP
jgi:CTP:molybdopterin cytidylyltransferase MocA